MNAVAYEAFLPSLLPYVPNCFEGQAIVALRNACIDYCQGTLILQQDIDPIAVSAGINTYEVDVPTGYRLAQVMELYYLGRRLERRSEMELQKLYTMNWQMLLGSPKAWTQFNPDEVTLVLCPSETVANALTGRCALVPTRSSTTVDGILLERYQDDIVCGALSRLKMTPDEPYSDPAGAAQYAARFRSGTATTRAYVNGGMTHAPMRVRFNRLW